MGRNAYAMASRKRRFDPTLVLFFFLVLLSPSLGVGQEVVRAPVTGVVEMGLAPFLERTIEEAEASGAVAVILDIDTPGGRVDAAERIIDALGDASIPVYAYVNTRAYSAGAMIALATDRIFMRRGAVMGAVTPVDGQGTKGSEKIVSAMRAQMRTLAEAHNLDPRLAEAMVDESLAVEGVVEAGKLLTFTTEEAVRVGYAEQVADWDDLMSLLELEESSVRESTLNWAEQLVRLFTHPVVAPFLLSLGFLGLIVEIKTAGFGLAGVAGFLSLSLFFGAHLLIGLAGAEDLILFGVGAALIGLEVFVIPGFGIFGIAGLAAVLGGVLMSQIGDLPTRGDINRATTVLTAASVLVVFVGWWLIRSVPNSRRLRESGVMLPGADREDGYDSSEIRNDLVGARGVAITDLHPTGTGLFGDERVDVVSEAAWVVEGSPIEVLSAQGYRHIVRVVEDESVPPEGP